MTIPLINGSHGKEDKKKRSSTVRLRLFNNIDTS